MLQHNIFEHTINYEDIRRQEVQEPNLFKRSKSSQVKGNTTMHQESIENHDLESDIHY